MKKVQLITDGACLGNPGPGGWAAILRFNDKKKEIWNSEPHTTNNRMELTAAIEGLKLLREQCEVEVVTDSEYRQERHHHLDPRLEAQGLADRRQKARSQSGLVAGPRRTGQPPQDYLDLDQRSRQPHRQQSLRRARHARGTRAVLIEMTSAGQALSPNVT